MPVLGDADPGISSSRPKREEMHNALASSPHSRSYQEKPTTAMQCPQRDRRGARAHTTHAAAAAATASWEKDGQDGQRNKGRNTGWPGRFRRVQIVHS